MPAPFDELFDTLPADGWLTREEARLLYDAASRTEGPILEVGCYKGRSTCLLAALGRPVYAVDPWDQQEQHFKGEHDGSAEECYQIFRRNLESRSLTNVIVYRHRIENWVALPCGFAYLDGDHTAEGTLRQILKAKECGVKGLCVHDVADKGGGVEVRQACLLTLGPWTERKGVMAWWDLTSKGKT